MERMKLDPKELRFGEFSDTTSTRIRTPLVIVQEPVERLKIALPTGELRNDVVSFFQGIGLNIPPLNREYRTEVSNMPIEFVFFRASSIPNVVFDERSGIKAGVTGSDIIWEAGMREKETEELPVYQLNPNARQSRLYVGMTSRFAERKSQQERREPIVTDLDGEPVATKLTTIANDFLSERGLTNISLFPVSGTDEAVQYIYPQVNGILGVLSSGETIRANNIRVIEIFYSVTVQMLKNADGKLSRRDKDILDDLSERSYLALQEKGMI